MKHCLLFLIVILLSGSATFSRDYPDSKGTEFYIAFMPNPIHYSGNTDSVFIYISATEPTSGHIEYRDSSGRHYNKDFSIENISKIYTFALPFKNFCMPITQEEKVVKPFFRVVADKEVSVYCLTSNEASSDAFLALPVNVLSNRYLVMSYYNNFSRYCPSTFSVLATSDGTTVEIIPSYPTKNNSTMKQTIVLNRGESYYVEASVYLREFNVDLTGTEIVSDKPVAVFGGHSCAAVTNDQAEYGSGDILIEQIVPVSSWGKNAFIAPFAQIDSYIHDVYRVMAADDNTKVTINGTETIYLNKGRFFQRDINEAVSIEADKPILAAQYKKSSIIESSRYGNVGDPFMTLIPSKEQFLTSYRIMSMETKYPSGRAFSQHYITVVADKSSIHTLSVDGKTLPSSSFFPIASTDHVYAMIDVAPGPHYLECNKPFGVVSYGYGRINSYGYNGGMLLSAEDLLPPEIMTGESCYKVDGTVTDSSEFDSGLISVAIDNRDNVATEIKMIDKYYYTFSSSLINQYYDGKFMITATDGRNHKAEKQIDIPGFTVWLKDSDPNGPPPVYNFQTYDDNEYCFDIATNNYGKFDQKIKSIYFRNNIFKVKTGSYTSIAAGETKTLSCCSNVRSSGIYTDTLVIANDCSQRVLAVITFKLDLDVNPPRIAVLSDPCNSGLNIYITDTLSTDLGLNPPTYNQLENCYISSEQFFPKYQNLVLTVSNPYQDAYFIITFTDKSGGTIILKDTIRGFTLEVVSGLSAGSFDFGSVQLGSRFCDTIALHNYGVRTLLIDEALAVENLHFSIPPGQLPIAIAPGETLPLAVCFMPLEAAGRPVTDTLRLIYNCINLDVPLNGDAEPLERSGTTRCGAGLKIISTSIPAGYVLGQNFPNPVTGEKTTVIFGLPVSEEVELNIYNLQGMKIFGTVLGQFTPGLYEAEIDTRSLANGVCIYELKTRNARLTKVFVINR